MEQYGNWQDVPENLKTKTALKKLGLKPKRGQKPVAIKTHWHWKTPDYYLFDQNECVPVREMSDAQKDALEKAKAASLESRTCTECGRVEELGRHYRHKLYVRSGLCDDCRDSIRADVGESDDDYDDDGEWDSAWDFYGADWYDKDVPVPDDEENPLTYIGPDDES